MVVPGETGPLVGSTRRRVLLLSPFAPRLDASMGGPLVIAQLIMALSRRERLGLLYLHNPHEPPLDDQIRAACEFAIETPRIESCPQSGLRKKRQHTLIELARGTPSWVGDWCEPKFEAALRGCARAWHPDIVQAEFHLMGQYLPVLGRSRPPTVLNQHEPGAEAARDRFRLGLMPGRVAPYLELRAWRRYERWLAGQVDAIVTFTERDREAMRAAAGAGRVHVIAPGSVLPEEPADPLGAEPPALLFFGNYLHAPNVDAALRLAGSIYPQVQKHAAGLGLWLVGDNPPSELSELAGGLVQVPGRVPRLESYVDRAAVVVVPIRMGGGIRVKVLEALGAGKAVVASPRALEGLNVTDGEQVLFAESDEDFVRQVLWLLQHPGERAALASRARHWAVANLGWDRAAGQYSALYDDLLRDRATRGAAEIRR